VVMKIYDDSPSLDFLIHDDGFAVAGELDSSGLVSPRSFAKVALPRAISAPHPAPGNALVSHFYDHVTFHEPCIEQYYS
jgi:hypothetical protein